MNVKKDYNDMREDITPMALMLAAANNINQINKPTPGKPNSRKSSKFLPLRHS
jgi:hypothetical protein